MHAKNTREKTHAKKRANYVTFPYKFYETFLSVCV
jgi:hypothetical protein